MYNGFVLKNKTKKTVISKDLKVFKSALEKTLGLLGKKEQTVLFKTRFGIHTFFLKTPIDVMILNNEYKVVKLKKELRPNRIFLWNPKFEIVIETQSGKIKESKTEKDDFLEL